MIEAISRHFRLETWLNKFRPAKAPAKPAEAAAPAAASAASVPAVESTGAQVKFPEMIEELKKFKIKQSRFDGPKYFEWVVDTSELAKMFPVLERFLGPSFKFGGSDGQKIKEFIDKFGGVRQGQGLFFSQSDSAIFYAMIWPWSDNVSATLRIEQIPDKKII